MMDVCNSRRRDKRDREGKKEKKKESRGSKSNHSVSFTQTIRLPSHQICQDRCQHNLFSTSDKFFYYSNGAECLGLRQLQPSGVTSFAVGIESNSMWVKAAC